MNWFIERANKAIEVSASSDPARSLVNAALHDLRPRATSVAVATTLNVSGSEGNWRLHAQDTNRTWTIASSGGLIYQLTDRLMSGLARVIETQHCLHAAAVSINGNAIVMPALSGSGKSSLAMWLVANGFDYISDEMVLIDKDHKIDGISRPIHIKSHGWQAIKHLLTDENDIYDGKRVKVVPISSINGQVSSENTHRAGILLFPRFESGASTTLTRISAAQAGLALIKNHINARNMPHHGFANLMQFARTSQSYSLIFGDCRSLSHSLATDLMQLMSDPH